MTEELRRQKYEMILKICGLRSRPYAYAISRHADRINFETQQIRAINLIDALFFNKVANPASEVAVIGGGIAGVTASARLLERGCNVTLIERGPKESGYFARQKKSSHRFIHPNIGFWPEERLRYTTNLPLLNWHADSCDRVIEQIDREWKLIREKYHSQFDSRFGIRFKNVSDVMSSASGGSSFYLRNIDTGSGANRDLKNKRYNLLILCTGFEAEDSIHEIASPNYWQLRNPTGTPLVVCGSGDGGLIDAILDVFDIKMEQLVGIAKAIENEYGREDLIKYAKGDPLEFAQIHENFLSENLPAPKKVVHIVTKSKEFRRQDTAFLHRVLVCHANGCYARKDIGIEVHENSEIVASKKNARSFEIVKLGGANIPLVDNQEILVRIGPARKISILDADASQSGKEEDGEELGREIETAKENDKEWVAFARTRDWDTSSPIERDRENIHQKAVSAIYRWIDHQRLTPPCQLMIDYCEDHFQIFSQPPIAALLPEELYGIALKKADDLPGISISYA